MCGRYTVLTEADIIRIREMLQKITLRLARDELSAYEETRDEIFPSARAPVVTSDGETLAFEHAQFGFVKWDGKGVIINARADTVKEKPMFKNHIKRGRCVVPATGYYEWKKEQGGKLKHLIKDKEGNILFMAGLWREGKDGREFVIITKEPVGDVKGIHDRMPVILRTDQLDAWLSGAMDIDELAGLDYECAAEPCEQPPGTNDQMSLF